MTTSLLSSTDEERYHSLHLSRNVFLYKSLETVIIDEDDDSTHSDKSSLLSSTSRILIPPPQNALPTDNIKGYGIKS